MKKLIITLIILIGFNFGAIAQDYAYVDTNNSYSEPSENYSSSKPSKATLKKMLFDALKKQPVDSWDFSITKPEDYNIDLDSYSFTGGNRIEFVWTYTSLSSKKPGYNYVEMYRFVIKINQNRSHPIDKITTKYVKRGR